MSTQPNPLDPLATAIADRVWALLQERLADSQAVQLVGVTEAAKRMGIGKSKLYEMISREDFPRKAIRQIGRRTLVVVSEMERWVSAQ